MAGSEFIPDSCGCFHSGAKNIRGISSFVHVNTNNNLVKGGEKTNSHTKKTKNTTKNEEHCEFKALLADRSVR